MLVGRTLTESKCVTRAQIWIFSTKKKFGINLHGGCNLRFLIVLTLSLIDIMYFVWQSMLFISIFPLLKTIIQVRMKPRDLNILANNLLLKNEF